MDPFPNGGSVVLMDATGLVPALRGRLNPILDELDRKYLHASNISIYAGKRQPLYIRLPTRRARTRARLDHGIIRHTRVDALTKVSRSVLPGLPAGEVVVPHALGDVLNGDLSPEHHQDPGHSRGRNVLRSPSQGVLEERPTVVLYFL